VVGTALLLAGAVKACSPQPYPEVPGLLRIFGGTGMGLGELSYPRAAALEADGNLLVVDKSARIQRFTPDGTPVMAWRMPDYDAGKPTGLGVGPDGRIYVADTHYSRVLVFAPDGREVMRFGHRGTGPGEFILPTDVLVTRDGFIYVGEYSGNDRISRFAPDGRYLSSFGGPEAGAARLQRPQGLLPDADGSLWVADACNHRICRFTAEGALVATLGREGTGAGELRFPYGLDWLSDGTLVVVEYGNNRVQRFTREGQSLGTWGSAGRRPGQLAYPWAVVVGPGDRMYVIDSGNNRVQVLDARHPGVWRQP